MSANTSAVRDLFTKPFNCDISITVNELVYVDAADHVALASAASLSTAQFLGFVVDKPTLSTCIVQIAGENENLSGLVAGLTYYLSDTPGQFSTTPGTHTVVMGTAFDTTTLLMVPGGVGLSGIGPITPGPWIFGTGLPNSARLAGTSTAGGSYTTAAGAACHAYANYSTIGGGKSNKTYATYATIGGGERNQIGGPGITVAGRLSAIGGGFHNTINGRDSFIGAGGTNLISGNYAVIGGGGYNHATGDYSTVPGGNYNTASGVSSLAEGFTTTASGKASHAEGYKTTASGAYGSHAEGYHTTAAGHYSHAEGGFTTATASYTHAEGSKTTALGSTSHAEGYSTHANAAKAHAEGDHSVASGIASHAEGERTTASGGDSHAEGRASTASGSAAHAEGGSTASADYSHAEGYLTTASGYAAHAEGYKTIANASNAHAEGLNAYAYGVSAHAEGRRTQANSAYSHAGGHYAVTSLKCQFARAGNRFSAAGDAQHMRLPLMGATLGATTTELTIDGQAPVAGNRAVLTVNSTWAVEVLIVAREIVGANHAAFKRYLLIRNNSGTVSLVGTVQTIGTDIGSNAGAPPAGWSLAITADVGNGSLKIAVTNGNATNVRWFADVTAATVVY